MTSRYICEIHDEIDQAVKVGRIDLVKGLVEEARSAGKRMESGLYTRKDKAWKQKIKIKELKAKIKKLKKGE